MASNGGLLAFIREYMDQLDELETAVKSKINSLSMLAAEEAAATPAAASAVAAAIEKRIQSVKGVCAALSLPVATGLFALSAHWLSLPWLWQPYVALFFVTVPFIQLYGSVIRSGPERVASCCLSAEQGESVSWVTEPLHSSCLSTRRFSTQNKVH